MSEWSAQLAKAFLRQQAEEKRKGNEESRIKDFLNAEAPKFWACVVQELRRMCDELNAEPGTEGALSYDDSKPDVLSVKTPRIIAEGRRREIKLQFTRHSREISVTGDMKAVWVVDLYPNCTDVATIRGQARDARPIDIQLTVAGLIEGLLGIDNKGAIL